MKAALLLTAVAGFGAAGCTPNDLSLSILQMEAVTRASMCVAMGSGAATRSRGVLDVSLVTSTGYIAVPLIRNNLMSQQNGVEFNAIQLLGANIKLSDTAGGTLTLPSGQQSFFYAASGGRLDPAGSAPMFVEALPAAAAKSLASKIPAAGLYTVIADVRPVGMRSSDQVVGGPLSFPIDLCNGCLVPAAPACPLPKGSTPTDPCFPQQDDSSVCCTMNGQLLCGALAPVAAM